MLAPQRIDVRNNLTVLLDKHTGLLISDLIPILPKETKMRDLKEFLKQGITQQTSEIRTLQKKMER